MWSSHCSCCVMLLYLAVVFVISCAFAVLALCVCFHVLCRLIFLFLITISLVSSGFLAE